MIVIFSLGALFLKALFFLISGLFTEDSLERKGPSRFARDRLLRLGIPFAIYTLLLWPLLEYALLEPYLHTGFWRSVGNTDPILDNGPMWFVGVLLLFSLAIVAWRSRFLRPARSVSRREDAPGHPGAGRGYLHVRRAARLPADSNQPLNLKLWAWPEYIALFGIGVAAARRGWLRPVPDALAQRCGIAALVAIACTAASIITASTFGLTADDYFGRLGIPALLAAMTEGVVAVTAPIWILAFAQRHLNGTGPLRRSMARSSYLMIMLQGPVLVALALALRPADLTGDVKALLVATLGIVGSFAIAWPIVTRTRMGRVI